jgi:hypothetical protein
MPAGPVDELLAIRVHLERTSMGVAHGQLEADRVEQLVERGGPRVGLTGLDALERLPRDTGVLGQLTLAHSPRSPGGAQDGWDIHAGQPAGSSLRCAGITRSDVDGGYRSVDKSCLPRSPGLPTNVCAAAVRECGQSRISGNAI